MKFIFHIDFNSFFATVEQQANPRLRGKPIGVTGGDRMKRTVVGAASIEAKTFGVRTGMSIPEALKLCPQLILVKGDSDKYLECTKRFLNILKDYSPKVEVFSIDEVFMEIDLRNENVIANEPPEGRSGEAILFDKVSYCDNEIATSLALLAMTERKLLIMAQNIKQRIYSEVGDFISCSIGISYNKMLSKFAGSIQKPDGLVGIFDPESAMMLLDQAELDDVCGIGFRIKKRLNNMGIFSFKDLREVPLKNLLASFKSYGQVLYNFSRGIDPSEITPFYEKEEVKSVGHRHTTDHDIGNPDDIKQVLLKISELIGRRLRAKKLVGRTVVCYYRAAFQFTNPDVSSYYGVRGESSKTHSTPGVGISFQGDGMQITIPYTNDGLEIFQAGWRIFQKIWDGEEIRMIGASISNLKPENPENLSLLEDTIRSKKIIKVLDKINNKYGEFTLQRGVLLSSPEVYRKANPFLADRRFKL